MLRSNTMI